MEGNKQTGVKFIEVYNKLYNEIEHLFVCVSIYTKKKLCIIMSNFKPKINSYIKLSFGLI